MAQSTEQRAAKRCCDEVYRALLYNKALNGLEKANSFHAIDFIRLSQWAMFNDMISHAIKVFRKSEAAGLEYLIKEAGKRDSEFFVSNSAPIAKIRRVEPKLNKIRNSTHMHLSKEGVISPKDIWTEADLSGTELLCALEAGFQLLCLIHVNLLQKSYEPPSYDGSDATVIAEYAYKHDLLYRASRDSELEAVSQD